MKEHDGLDEFIRKNREAFDDKDVPDVVWNNISEKLHSRERRTLWQNVMLWRSAAILFMALSGYLLISSGQLNSARTSRADDTGRIALNEFQDVEAFYISQISQKVELIESIASEDLSGEVIPDFQQLEAMYLVLKEEMKNRPSKKVKDALVLNLLVRINLLNEQLHKLEEGYKGGEEGKKSEV